MDNSLLFFKASAGQTTHIKETSDNYGTTMGQCINPSKCSLMLGVTCPMAMQDQVCNTLDVTTLGFEERYLVACRRVNFKAYKES